MARTVREEASATKASGSYPIDEITRMAREGPDAVHSFTPDATYGTALLGAEVWAPTTRFYSLDSLVLLPPIFTPLRLAKMEELAREPLYSDVDTSAEVGDFRTLLPITVASMGSTDVVNRLGLLLAEGAAKAGLIMGLGENVATVWGYDRRIDHRQPCFKERALTYLANLPAGMGGLLVQQSVEDAYDELWNRVYSDPELTPYVEKGLLGFEVKLGQGAKPGLGGEIQVNRDHALRLKQKFYFPVDPEVVVQDEYGRYSAPGTYTPEILRSMIRLIRNNYPRVRLWLKLGPYRDLDEVVDIAVREGVDAMVLDGKEGGTGMAPGICMRDLGLPTLSCLGHIRKWRGSGIRMPAILSGRLHDGGDVVKALCLGASATAIGRPFVIAAQVGGSTGVLRYVEAVQKQVQLLISALGKYRLTDLAIEDIGALVRDVAAMLQVQFVYAS